MNRPTPLRERPATRHHAQLVEALEPHHSALVHHPVYSMIEAPEALCTFMTSHVFAVWDFMTLLKALQRALTCVELPWTPPADPLAARLINEIVLSEETDEIHPGVYISHFELYRAAMDEVGADRAPVDGLLAALRAGREVGAALDGLAVPEQTRDFVRCTMALAARPPHEVAAAFLLGRERLIPAMFIKLLAHHRGADEADISRVRLRARTLAIKLARAIERRASPTPPHLPEGPPPQAFRVYLERHIELDGESHGPMGERLLQGLCGRDPVKWSEAQAAAERALRARRAMWDGVVGRIQQERALASSLR